MIENRISRLAPSDYAETLHIYYVNYIYFNLKINLLQKQHVQNQRKRNCEN